MFTNSDSFLIAGELREKCLLAVSIKRAVPVQNAR
jgi:hypothetical protein